MKKPLGILFHLGDTVLEYYYYNPIEGTKKILENSINPYNATAEEIQELVVKLTEETFGKRDMVDIEVSLQSFQRLLYENFNIEFKVNMLEIEKIFCLYAFKSKPSEGVQALFNILDEKKIKYAALSNSSFTSETLRYELKESGLNTNFQFIMSSCEYCLRKPNKLLFDLAAKKLGVDPSDIWFIGDSYKYDMIGAKSAGMLPIFYNRKNSTVTKGMELLEVSSMYEIEKLIKEFK
ncbi:HAD family hydrolase [Clostridium sp. UBA5119]|uniref:HAD family hydrolase n=1 Tax=Clostridium sp. UBA5119 TaxID=1946366 RepID=UPI003216992D